MLPTAGPAPPAKHPRGAHHGGAGQAQCPSRRVTRPHRNPRQTSHRVTVTQCGQVLLAARIRVDLVGTAIQPDSGPDDDPAAHRHRPREAAPHRFARNFGMYSENCSHSWSSAALRQRLRVIHHAGAAFASILPENDLRPTRRRRTWQLFSPNSPVSPVSLSSRRFGVSLPLRSPLRVGQGVGTRPCEAACVTSSPHVFFLVGPHRVGQRLCLQRGSGVAPVGGSTRSRRDRGPLVPDPQRETSRERCVGRWCDRAGRGIHRVEAMATSDVPSGAVATGGGRLNLAPCRPLGPLADASVCAHHREYLQRLWNPSWRLTHCRAARCRQW